MLEKYIKQLLNENDEVVVPKLGTFVAGYAGSEISGSRVAPPSKKIHFYEKLKSDKNELLRKRVTETEGISISDFQSELEKLTTKIEDELLNSGSSHIPHLGIVKKKPDGSLEFEQDDDNFLDDSFGLPAIDRKPLNKRENKEENRVVPPPTSELVFDKDAQKETVEENHLKDDAAVFSTLGSRLIKDPVEEEARLKKEKEDFLKATSHVENPPAKKETIPPVIQVETEEEEEEEEKKSSLVLWLIAIPILFAFAFLLYIYTDAGAMASVRSLLGQKPKTTIVTNDNPTSTNTDNITENTTSDATTTDNSVTNSTDNSTVGTGNTESNSTTDNTANTTTTTTNNGTDPATQYTGNSETQPADIINDPNNRFYIVIGSFAEIENARRLRTDLQGSGVTNSKIVMYPKRGMYRVTVGDEPSQREAYNRRNSLGTTYPDMWVLNY